MSPVLSCPTKVRICDNFPGLSSVLTLAGPVQCQSMSDFMRTTNQIPLDLESFKKKEFFLACRKPPTSKPLTLSCHFQSPCSWMRKQEYDNVTLMESWFQRHPAGTRNYLRGYIWYQILVSSVRWRGRANNVLASVPLGHTKISKIHLFILCFPR